MGWASGSTMAEELYCKIERHLYNTSDRRAVAKIIYNAFCDEDADDWDCTSEIIVDGEIDLEEEN